MSQYFWYNFLWITLLLFSCIVTIICSCYCRRRLIRQNALLRFNDDVYTNVLDDLSN